MDGLVEEETSARSWSQKAARPCRWLHGKRKRRRDLRLPRARSRRARKRRRRRQLRALGTGREIATTGTGKRKSFGLPDGRRLPGCGRREPGGRLRGREDDASRPRGADYFSRGKAFARAGEGGIARHTGRRAKKIAIRSGVRAPKSPQWRRGFSKLINLPS